MPAPVKSTSTAASRCRAFYYQAPGLEPARVRALSKREAFVASRRRRRQAPEAGADLRSKYADVPLPAPSSTGDLGSGESSKVFPHRLRDSEETAHSRCASATRACRRPVARSIEHGRSREHRIQPAMPVHVHGPGHAARSRCVFASQIRRRPHGRSMLQNVRLMPAAHTRTRARYNGWVTTNVPITKKEPL